MRNRSDILKFALTWAMSKRRPFVREVYVGTSSPQTRLCCCWGSGHGRCGGRLSSSFLTELKGKSIFLPTKEKKDPLDLHKLNYSESSYRVNKESFLFPPQTVP